MAGLNRTTPRHATTRFFRKPDWIAFWITLSLSLIIYVATLAPTVTLEDSGELAVAADYLGVPHPPGYPLWTMLAWAAQVLFGFVTYQGHPNPAWAVGLLSAVLGAIASALTALLISRSGDDLLRTMTHKGEGDHAHSHPGWLPSVAGTVAGLLLAFSPVFWSQSVIVEVYTLNAVFLALLVMLMYRALHSDRNKRILCITALTFGLGLTNHQALLFIAPAALVALWFHDRRLGRDSLTLACLGAVGFLIIRISGSHPQPEFQPQQTVMIVMAVLFLSVPIGLYFIERKLMTEWRSLLLLIAFAALGLSVYGYMPIASAQNPPMNWGYSRTWTGFLYAISRGQYEKINPIANIIAIGKHPFHFLQQLNAVITSPRNYCSVVSQFTTPIALLGLLPFLCLLRMNRRGRRWIYVTAVAFIFLTVVFVIFQYPKLDTQNLFVERVQYIQSYMIFALWTGYGLLLVMAWAARHTKGTRWGLVAVTAVAIALPIVPLARNARDNRLVDLVGSADQNGHDFGWQFGAGQLRGAQGLLDSLSPAERQTYPDPTYPPPMEPNAIFFGGTDPGRFVPTYMIYSAKVREDVYLITQNSLADPTYMNVMRDLYGARITLPTPREASAAFTQYVTEVRSGIRPPADIHIDDTGRIQLMGTGTVMQVNGILARMIFEQNKKNHAFYVEESYPIPWMYPYLQPHGLIMQLHKEPLPKLTKKMVDDDRAFWNWYTARLLANPKFHRDLAARKTFAKLRSAIAGLYAVRGIVEEAEYAYKQALELHPMSGEAGGRLATLYIRQQRYAEAFNLIQMLQASDPLNARYKQILNLIERNEKFNKRRVVLETLLNEKKANVNDALELVELYQNLDMTTQLNRMVATLLSDTNLPPDVCLRTAQTCASIQRSDLVSAALRKYLERQPRDARVWMELAAVQAVTRQATQALTSLKKAIDLGGAPIRKRARQDPRFHELKNTDLFRRLTKPRRAST